MVEVGKHLTCGFKVELWHRLPHAAAAAAARVQEKQRHSEDLALKHNRRLGGAMSDPRSPAFLSRPAPRATTRNTLCWGHPSFCHPSFSHTPSPGHKDWHAYHRSHCYPSTPGLAGAGGAGEKSGDRKSSVGRAKPGSSEVESSRNTQHRNGIGQKRRWALLLLHISTQHAQFLAPVG